MFKCGFFIFLLLNSFCFKTFAESKVIVFAASSISLPLTEIAESFQKKKPNSLTLSFGASSSLARQISYGAPASIYISANNKWMKYVEENTHILYRNDWLSNQLVLIANSEFQTDNFSINQLTEKLIHHRLAIANPQHVPLGIYSKEALIEYGLWNKIDKRLAFANNARAALALVERGEAPLGIVFYTDALASPSVKMVFKFSTSSHSKIRYIKSLLKNSNKNALEFYHYLESEDAKKIFTKYGFSLIESEIKA